MFNNLVIQTDKKEWNIGKGVGQGWGVSCILFNIFTNDLTTDILKYKAFPQIYADDTNVVGTDHIDSTIQLDNMIKIN